MAALNGAKNALCNAFSPSPSVNLILNYHCLAINSGATGPFRMELQGKCMETVFIERFTHLAHQVQVVMQIMDSIQARTENFLGAVQVMQVSTREIAAGVATAGFIERRLIFLVFGILDLDVAKTGKQPAITRIAGRHHAIE